MRNSTIFRCQPPAKGRLIAVSAILLGIALTIDAAERLSKFMNPEADPCQDIYEFACGGFIKSMTIPSDKNTITSFDSAEERVQRQLREALEEESRSDELKTFALAKNLYKTCMNEDAIEAHGVEPLRRTLKESGNWPVIEGPSWDDSGFTWGESIFELDQPIFALPRAILMNGTDNPKVIAYFKYMVDLAVALGADRHFAEEDLKDTLDLEMQLASITLPPEDLRDWEKLYNPMTLAELSDRYQSIPWKTILDKLLLPEVEIGDDDIFVVWAKDYLDKLDSVMSGSTKRAQANYVRRRAFLPYVPYLNKELREKRSDFVKAIMGSFEDKPRWQECVDTVSMKLPLSVGALYVAKYFNDNAKAVVVDMITDMKAQLKETLETVDWLDDVTRQRALEKLEAMAFHVAYPDELKDHAKLEEYHAGLRVSTSSYYQMMMELVKFNEKKIYGTLRELVDKKDWRQRPSPATVDAYYNFMENSIQLPAGILQDIFFNDDRPKYLNYGTIGYVIGHEMTHGFDDVGRQFDGNGKLNNWWTNQTLDNFHEKATCIIYQYGNYTVKEVGLKLNGKATQGENIADNGGMKIAYLASQKDMQENGPGQKLPQIDLSPEKLFWINMATVWCDKYRPEKLEMKIRDDAHTPGRFRVIGPFSNLKEVARVFECSEESPICRKNACSVW